MSDFNIIGTAELERRLSDGEIRNFWCVLTDEYFSDELIPGSRRVPVDQVVREARALGLDEDAEIVVYCSGPDCPQSTAAAQKLADLGFRNVHDYEIGISAWKEAGHPITPVTAGATAD